MKKWLICLTVLFSAFLFTNKVSALEFHHIDELEMFSQPITEDYLYTTYNVSKETYPYVIMYTSDTSIPANGTTMYYYVKFFKKNTSIRYGSGGWIVNGSNTYTSGLRSTKVGSKTDLSSTDISLKTGSTGSGGFSNYLYYFSNFDMLSYTTVDGSRVNTDDVSIPANNISNSKNFKETINSMQYSKVELIFDVPNMETNFNFNYDFHLVDSNGNLDTLNTFKSPYFEETYTSCTVDENGVGSCKPLPVVDNFVIKNTTEDDGQCHIDEFGLNNCYKPNDYSNNEELNISNSYVVKNYDMAINNNILTKMTTKLKFVLDLEFNSSVYIDASFTSSLPFEVKYYERTTTTDYYSTIDLTGKYGALFMPKFDNLEDTLNIRTLFKGDGHLDIQHRSSIDLIDYKILSAYSMNYCNEYLYNQDNIPYSCSEYSGEFEFYVSNNNLEQGLFFVNSHFDNDNSATATITYDTRYYVYWVFDTPSSIVPVENPNTGEKEYISLDGFYNYADVDPGFLESLFNKFTDQLYDTFPVIQQFLMVINLFDYNEEYDEAPKLMVSLDSIGIDQEVQIVDFGVFHEHRATLIFWEMLFITTITIIKVTDNVVKAMKD